MKQHSFNLTLPEVAKTMGISQWGLRARMRTRGPHSARKIGRRWRFSKDVFDGPLALPG